jgi:hypothetical protein
MGKQFERFLAERKNWRSFEKFDELSDVLLQGLRESDLSRKSVLETLVALVGTPIDVGSEAYEAVSKMGESGWLASEGIKAVKSNKPAQRQEGARWIRFGRNDGEVTKEQIAAMEKLLTDKLPDVRSTAISALGGMLADNPEAVLPVVMKWFKRLKGPSQVFAAATLTVLWGTKAEEQAFSSQLSLLRDPKTRSSFFLTLRERLRHDSIPADSAVSGWDHLIHPYVTNYGSDSLPAGSPPGDSSVCVAAGVLFAGYASEAIKTRVDDLLNLMLERRNPALNPVTVALGPWIEFGTYALNVHNDYADWLNWQIARISKSARGLWQPEIATANKYLDALRAGKPEMPESRLPNLYRSALALRRKVKSK